MLCDLGQLANRQREENGNSRSHSEFTLVFQWLHFVRVHDASANIRVSVRIGPPIVSVTPDFTEPA